ncbi:MAG: hypothetical protein K2G19_02450, partial [Lachnospiraceae bacterium]|nr:hypothetical protein [Lachnospiraceae bacterium]
MFESTITQTRSGNTGRYEAAGPAGHMTDNFQKNPHGRQEVLEYGKNHKSQQFKENTSLFEKKRNQAGILC